MRITWHIEKRRGNLRPVLTYAVALEGCEKELAMPLVRVESSIPEPPASWQAHCYPHEHERAGAPPAGRYQLSTPGHARARHEHALRLPWREDNAYPEVEESFQELRRAFEAALAQAHASEPMDLRGELDLTQALRRGMAPSVMAERLLRLAK